MLDKPNILYIAEDFHLLSLPSIRKVKVLFTRLELDEAKKMVCEFANKGIIPYGFIDGPELREILKTLLGVNFFDKLGIPHMEWCRAMLVAKYYGRRLKKGETELPKSAKIEFFLVEMK